MEERTLLVLQGVPASGKTTWAKKFIQDIPNWVRVNRDDIRANISGAWSRELENHVKDIEHFIITSSLNTGKNVIVDDTNLNPTTIDELRELASMYEAEFLIKEFRIDLRTALARNAQRENPLPEKEVCKFFVKYYPEEMVDKREMKAFEMGKKTCIICDLDGTLALNNGRDWFDYDKVITDKVDWRISHLINKLGHDIVFLTGRDEESRSYTERWIEEVAGIKEYQLIMRPHGDKRSDQIIKRELYVNHIEPKYNVACVFEDRNKVVEMWRSLGLLCLQVCEGNY